MTPDFRQLRQAQKQLDQALGGQPWFVASSVRGGGLEVLFDHAVPAAEQAILKAAADAVPGVAVRATPSGPARALPAG